MKKSGKYGRRRIRDFRTGKEVTPFLINATRIGELLLNGGGKTNIPTIEAQRTGKKGRKKPNLEKYNLLGGGMDRHIRINGHAVHLARKKFERILPDSVSHRELRENKGVRTYVLLAEVKEAKANYERVQ